MSLGPGTTAVAVRAADLATGARADLPGRRDAVGEGLLVVDGIQGFGAVDLDGTLADVLVVRGRKWLRSGWVTGFLALSDRARDRLHPPLSGWTGALLDGLNRLQVELRSPRYPLVRPAGARRPVRVPAGVSATVHAEQVRLSVRASTGTDTVGRLRDALARV